MEQENPWEARQAEQGEQGELLANHSKEEEEKETARSNNCGESILHCLSHVPCASLIAWIMLVMGLGGFTGSILVGVQRTRDLIDDDNVLWFIEYTLIGVVTGMFVIGTSLLCVGHLSSDPTSRHAFNTTKKNFCARGLNITMLILSYILGIAWILVTAITVIPAGLLGLLIYIHDVKEPKCINLVNYGFHNKEYCDGAFRMFTNEGRNVFVCYLVAMGSAVLVAASLIHFMVCISANIMHLRDTRFATMNAYVEAAAEVEAEEIRNSKQHSMVDDTTM